MKFQKRTLSDQELAFAMSQSIISCVCGCEPQRCDCPPIPTHQIQMNQSDKVNMSQVVHVDRYTIMW